MRYAPTSILLLFVCAAVCAAGQTNGTEVTSLEWLRQQTPPRFRPGHTLPLLGQMHCVNPPAELRAELARNWGFAVRLSRPKGEPELLQLCARHPAIFRPTAMIGNLANLEGDASRKWPEGTFLRKSDGTLVEGRQIFSPEMPDPAWQIVIDAAIQQIDGQIGSLPAEALATVEQMSYLAGMLGGVTTGEFDCNVRYETFDPAHPPHWLDQMLVLAHAHALFSWIESELRNSQLLPGPKPHAWNKNQPAYEFPTGFANTRVVARRLKDARRWLIGAWAADGVERKINVVVPALGEYSLLARPAGTVHLVEKQAEECRLLDIERGASQRA